MGKTIAERGTPPHILQPDEEEERSDKGEKVRTNSGVWNQDELPCLHTSSWSLTDD